MMIFAHANLVAGGQVVPFKEQWANKTGYMDNAVHDKELIDRQKAMGFPMAFASTDPFGRKMVLVFSDKGNICFFQRYGAGSSVVVSNETQSLRCSAISSAIPAEVEDAFFAEGTGSLEKGIEYLLADKAKDTAYWASVEAGHPA